MMLARGIFLAPLLLFAASTFDSNVASSATPSLSFERDIQPVFDKFCVTCHRNSGPMQGLTLERGVSYRFLMAARSTQAPMQLVRPGDLSGSYLWLKIDGNFLAAGGTGYPMPYFPGNPIDPASKDLIRRWILAGARQ